MPGKSRKNPFKMHWRSDAKTPENSSAPESDKIDNPEEDALHHPQGLNTMENNIDEPSDTINASYPDNSTDTMADSVTNVPTDTIASETGKDQNPITENSMQPSINSSLESSIEPSSTGNNITPGVEPPINTGVEPSMESSIEQSVETTQTETKPLTESSVNTTIESPSIKPSMESSIEASVNASGITSHQINVTKDNIICGRCSFPGIYEMYFLALYVVFTWAQDPLLSFVASAACTFQHIPSAIAAVGGATQICDGIVMLTIPLGIAVSALCNRAKSERRDPSYVIRIGIVGTWMAAIAGILLSGLLYMVYPILLKFFFAAEGKSDIVDTLDTSFDADIHIPNITDTNEETYLLNAAGLVTRIRCFSLPFSVMSVAIKAVLMTLGDTSPQIVSLVSLAISMPLLFGISYAYAKDSIVSHVHNEEFLYWISLAMLVVQIVSSLVLFFQLGMHAMRYINTSESNLVHEEAPLIDNSKHEIYTPELCPKQFTLPRRCDGLVICKYFRKLAYAYKFPTLDEIIEYKPLVFPLFTQCFVRLTLYASMTKCVGLWGLTSLAAHQLVFSLYTVLGLPSDTLAQVGQKIFSQAASRGFCESCKMDNLDMKNFVLSKLFNMGFFSGLISAILSAVISTLLGYNVGDNDRLLSNTVIIFGLFVCIPLFLIPFASILEGFLLLNLKGDTVAIAYIRTLPLNLIALYFSLYLPASYGIWIRSLHPATAVVPWLLVIIYNSVKILTFYKEMRSIFKGDLCV